MKFQGHQKISFIDYPGKISTVFFTHGCNFRCGYCHNKELVDGCIQSMIEEDEALKYIDYKSKYIDAVCISGGEATLHNKLYQFIKKVKKKGMYVKIDTNGTNPDLIERLLNEKLLDYIAMDIKAPFNKYKNIVNVDVKVDDIYRCIELIKNSDIEYEFRTTVCKEMLSVGDIVEIAKDISCAKRYVLQNFRDDEGVLDGANKYTSYSKEEMTSIEGIVSGFVEELKLRM